MLYISGSDDTFDKLRQMEGYEGTLEDYKKELARLNPQLFKTFSKNSQQLPSYMPMYLANLPRFESSHADEVVRIVSQYDEVERKALRGMQEDMHDTITHVATGGILEEYQAYVFKVKKFMNDPYIKSDMDLFNRAFPRKGFAKFTGEFLKHGSKTIAESASGKEKLFALMLKRDELNHAWLQTNPKGAAAKIKEEVRELTREIKRMLPKKLSESKYLHGLPRETAMNTRHGASSLKLAGKGIEKIKATHLDRLTISGLEAQRKMIKAFQYVGDKVKKGATYLTYTLAAVSVLEAYHKGEDVLRATLKEGAGIGANLLIGTAVSGGIAGLGGIAIGAIVGDITLGATILVCYPVIGWVVLAVAGLAVASYFSSETKEIAGKIYDGYQSGYVEKKASEFFNWIWEQYRKLGPYAYSESQASPAAKG